MMIPVVPDGSGDPLAEVLENVLKECCKDNMGIASTCDFLAAACRERILAETGDPRMTRPSRLATLYLSLEEINVIAVHLAYAVNPTQVALDAQDASGIIWNAPNRPLILGSLATMFAELHEQLTRMDRLNDPDTQ